MLLYTIFVLGFLWGQIQRNIQELNTIRADFVNNEAQRKALEEFQKIVREDKDKLRQIDQLFISKDVPLEFVLFLQNLAKENEVSIDLTGGSGSKSDAWDFLTFQATLDGQFPDVLRFVAQLEGAPYLIDIQNLQVSSLDSKDGEGDITSGISRASLALKVYAK